ncbi:MAG: hypothetical protein JNL12_21235 [Planctomycetes bacterium]|nr:hypothetical protein [Planctomycetota bacterium]
MTTMLTDPRSDASPATTPPTAAVAAAELARLRARARTGIWIETGGLLALLLVAFALPSFLTDRSLRLEWIYRAVLLASFVVVVGRLVLRRLVVPLRQPLDDEEMALAVERSAPEVRQALISSLQFARDLRGGGRSADSPALMAAVVEDVRGRLSSIPFAQAIDRQRVRRFGAGLLTALACFGAWALLDAGTLGLWARRNLLLADVDWPRYTRLSLVDSPHEVRLPQGDALTVRVAVDGEMPDQAFVAFRFEDGETGSEALSRTGEREFTWTIESVRTDAQLAITAGDSLELPLAVTIVERPRLEGLVVTVVFPDYMERAPLEVPTSEGELRLPKGASLQLRGQSHKPLEEAFALFASDQKVALPLGADGRSFAGAFAPPGPGLLVVDVIDRDRLGAAVPPKLLLRVGEDKAPTLEFRLRGIGSSITAQAILPGELKAKDDFGLRALGVEWRVIDDRPKDSAVPQDGAPVAEEVPFAPAEGRFESALESNALRHETLASVDLRQWNKGRDENDPNHPIRPGMLLSLRYWAKDNFGPGEPHTGHGEAMAFRVVPIAQLTEELRRRQIEQRTELGKLLEEHQAATLELQELPNPADAGDRRTLVEGRLKALVRRQQSLGRRVGFVGETYQRLLWEYENNRLIEANRVREMEALIPRPLESIGKESFPIVGRQIDAFAATPDEPLRAEAIAGAKDIERRILAVLAEMKQAESLAALIEELKGVIRLGEDARRDAESRAQGREDDIFRSKKPKQDPSKPPNATEPPKDPK